MSAPPAPPPPPEPEGSGPDPRAEVTADRTDEAAAALAEDRARTRARIDGLARDLARIVEDAALTPPDDEHDPDGATIGFERAQVSALLADARGHLADLDAAEARLVAGTAATCEACGGPIPFERLLARPTARRCVPCAT